MTPGCETNRWRILAPVELNSRNASEAVVRVLETADYLRADVTLTSALRSWPFGSWRNTRGLGTLWVRWSHISMFDVLF